MSETTPNAAEPLRIGILYENVQLSDIVGIDLLGNLTPKIVSIIINLNPSLASLASVAVPMEFLYISSSLEPAWATPSIFIKPTHTYANAPRDLDILLLGGPDPSTVHEESLTFLREASKKTKVLMTTCTGGMWLAKAGVLDGKRATTNRMMLEGAKRFFPKVEWQDQRWVVEEGRFEGQQIWTAGGAGCGIDMMIEYTTKNFDMQLVEMACEGLEFPLQGRSQSYKAPLTTASCTP